MLTYQLVRQSLWHQFGASIDMLTNAILQWPDETWGHNKKVFYIAYHSCVFLDYYLTNPPKGFTSPLPFTITPIDQAPPEAIDDVVPDRFYSKQELLDYLQVSREKCRKFIEGLTEQSFSERWMEDPDTPGAMDYNLVEILLYNMRHVQHHAAQLNLLLRQQLNRAPGWIGRAKDEF